MAKAAILTRKWTIYLTGNLNDRSIIYELSWGRGRKSGKSQVYPELFLPLCGVCGITAPEHEGGGQFCEADSVEMP